MRGSVTDFIATAYMDFPVFNVADIAVTCGIVMSFIGYIMWERSLPPEER
jgi:signal peptidase II